MNERGVVGVALVAPDWRCVEGIGHTCKCAVGISAKSA